MSKGFSLKFDGLDTFKQELQALTGNLVSEAEDILITAAHEAADAVRAAYPYRHGGLRGGVTVVPSRGRTLAGAEVKNLAPHAIIYEDGTVTRETHQGYNRGRQLGTPTFRPITARYHDQALTAVIHLLYAHGAARVTGDPNTD
jgi:hypothetical protein